MPEVSAVKAITFTTLPARRASNYLRYEIYDQPDEDMECDFAVWVIDTGSGPIVFDTGFTQEAAEARGQSISSPVAAALREAGYEPADVPIVVLSHLHYDHTGNLELFRSARVFVQRSEWEFWTGPLAERKQFVDLKEDSYLENLKAIQREGRLELIDGTVAVAPGVTTMLLGGHTVGTQALAIQGPNSSLVLASDAVHYFDEIDLDMPFAIVADLPAMYRSFDTLNELRSRGTVVVPGHDVRTARTFPSTKLPGGAIVSDLLPGRNR